MRYIQDFNLGKKEKKKQKIQKKNASYQLLKDTKKKNKNKNGTNVHLNP